VSGNDKFHLSISREIFFYPLNYNIMFLDLKHTKLDVFKFSQELALECYRTTKLFPDSEKFAMISQIRRAALSVHLNIAEGCSRKTKPDRKRFYEIARGSVVEIDAATGIAFKLNYASLEELKPLGEIIIRTFKLITGMIDS
jgi:four helix bundle protein